MVTGMNTILAGMYNINLNSMLEGEKYLYSNVTQRVKYIKRF